MSNLVTQHIPNLIGGVSQAAPSLRLPTQCDEQVNCRNDVVEGMGKRPNTQLNYQYGLGVPANGMVIPEDFQWFDLERDSEENYKLAVSTDAIRVFDAKSGTEYPVEYAPVANDLVAQQTHEERLRAYFQASGVLEPERNFSVLQSFDTSFILNKSVPVRPVLEPIGIEPTVLEQTRYTLSLKKHTSDRTLVSGVRRSRRKDVDDVRHISYNYYVLTIAGTTYENENVGSSMNTITRWAYELIEAAYPAADVIQNGYNIDVVVAAGETVSISGSCRSRVTEFPSGQAQTPYYRNTTFITSREYPDTVAVYNPSIEGALWYIKQADYKTAYFVELNGVECSIETPEATSSQARDGLKTVNLTADMAQAINDRQADHGCSAQQYGNVLFIARLDGTDFTITASDDLGGKASYAVKRYVNEFESLPPEAPEGFQVEVRGNPETEVDPYYVQFTKFDADTGNTGGIWKETRKYNIDYRLDPYSMPIALKRVQNQPQTDSNPSGIGFVIDVFNWAERTVGDEDTAPFPSFISDLDDRGRIVRPRTVKDIAIHKNRLVMVSEENLIMSEAGEFLNFFPTTVITVLDSDPIDVALNINSVSPIEHILEASGILFLFAPDKQMKVEYEGVLSVKTVDVRVLTSYEVNTMIKPFVVGDSIHFWQREKTENHLMEYYQYSTEGLWTARPLTKHVPRYIEGSPMKSMASPANNVIFTLCRDAGGSYSNILYVYNYYKEGEQLSQSAWQKWEFSSDVLDMTVKEDELYLTVKRPDGHAGGDPALQTYSERIVLKGRTELEAELGHRVFLDAVEEVDENFTVDPLNDSRQIVRYAGRYFVGFPYQQLYRFSEMFARSDDKVLTRGRLQVGHIFLNFTDTTKFTVEVVRGGREARVTAYSGRVVGSLANLIGSVPITSGQKAISVHSKSTSTTITILNESPQDAVFQTADWEGSFTQRARRI